MSNLKKILLVALILNSTTLSSLAKQNNSDLSFIEISIQLVKYKVGRVNHNLLECKSFIEKKFNEGFNYIKNSTSTLNKV